jgi:hypothetical protein
MPYMQICRANPDDGLWHDPTASGKTRCGKDSGKSQLSFEGRASDKTIITHANACTGCYPFLKSNPGSRADMTPEQQTLNITETPAAGCHVRSTSLFGVGDLECALVRHGVVHAAAIEDAEGFDMGMTREAILKVYEDITGMIKPNAAVERTETRKENA